MWRASRHRLSVTYTTAMQTRVLAAYTLEQKKRRNTDNEEYLRSINDEEHNKLSEGVIAYNSD
jgi:hypothetical protein